MKGVYWVKEFRGYTFYHGPFSTEKAAQAFIDRETPKFPEREYTISR